MKKILLILIVFIISSHAYSQVQIGASNYTTLTDAFTAINDGVHTGAISVNITGNTTETSSAILNASGTGSASYTSVLIKPTANNVSIEGDVAGALINLNGADFVTFDGRVGAVNSRELTIRNNNTATLNAAVRMSSLGAGLGATNNTVMWCDIWGGSTTPTIVSIGVYIAGATISITGTGADNDNNTVSNNHIRRCTHGIFSRGTSTANQNETINFSSNVIGSDNSSEYVVVTGIDMSNSINVEIYGNTIFNIISTHTTFLRGINLLSGMTNVLVDANKIHNIENNTTSSFVSGQGIFISGTGTVNAIISNNVIYGLHGRGSTTITNNSWGIMVTGGSNYNIYYNSISLFGDGTATTSTDRIGNILLNSSASTGLNVVNNALYNTRSPGNVNGFSYNIYSAAAAGNYGTINYNDYYGTGDRYFVGFLGSDRATLADWQTATGQDANSINSNPLFASESNLVPIPGSPLIGAGTPIPGFTTDITGAFRSATTPSIGAYENAQNPGPFITYDPLLGTASTGNRNLNEVTIVDSDGIAGGALAPRVYWRVNGGAWSSSATTSVSNPYDFIIGTTGLSTGDLVEYFVVAQDNLGAVSANPSTGFAATDVNNVTSFPSSPNSYNIIPSLSGTFTVGTGEDYLNLTAIANILNDNNSEVVGNVIFELTGNYDGTTGETLPIVFNEFVNAGALSGTPFTVTIRPASGVTNRITEGDPGSAFSTPVINFIGGKYFIFDGRPGGVGSSNEWTIRNTRSAATIGCVLRFADDGAYNTIRNLDLEGGQPTLNTTGVIFFHTSTGSIGNSFNSILFNNIRPRTGVASNSNGIFSNGSLDAPNSSNTISNNHIIDFNNNGITLLATNTGNGPDWVISDNNIYNPTHVSGSAQTGITVASSAATNTLISGNFIGGSGPNATGMMTNSGNVLVSGISCTNGLATITNNTISNISGTGTGTATRIQGIAQTSTLGSFEILNNTITNLSTTSTATGTAFGNQVARGIYVGPSGQFVGTNIIGNTIDNISIESTSPLVVSNVATGIAAYNIQGSILANNKISNIKNKTTGTTSGQFPIASGIFTSFFSNGVVVNNMISLGSGENTNTQFTGLIHVGTGGSNVHHYYYNSIAITGTAGGSISSFGFLRGTDTSTVQNQVMMLRDNIFSVDRAGGGSTNYAIGNKGSAAGSGWSSDYNDLYNPGGSIGFWDNTGHTFPGWQIASSGDANSSSKIVFFIDVATGDLHLTGTSMGDLDLSGTPIAGITTDFDGEPRNEDVPYMGADESSPPLPVELASFSATVDRRDVHLNWMTVSEINNSGFDIERKPVGAEEWLKINFVEGSGTTNEATNYSFTDRGLNSGKYNYRLKQIDYNGNFEYFNLSNEVSIGVPDKYDLSQNYPNPFNPVTKINFDLPFDSKVTMKIFDITGREIRTLVNEIHEAGYYTATFDAGSIASGVYFYRIIAEGGNEQYVMTKKMMVIK